MSDTKEKIDVSGFRVIDNVVSNCDMIIQWIEEQQNWFRSKINWEQQQVEDEIRTSSTSGIPFLSYRNPDFIADMNKAVYHAMDDYAKHYGFSFVGVEDLSVQKYEINQKYDDHTDYGYGNNRVLSAVLYLNTVDEGGETYFPYFDKAIKPVQGRLALFPSGFMWKHRANPPISNTKYACAFWAYG